MKIFLALFIGAFSLSSFGQENVINTISIEWEQLSTPLSIAKKETSAEKYHLLEVDLSIDLREQYLRKKTASIMYLPENRFIKPDYTVAVPGPRNSNVGFTISGRGYNSNQANIGGIKNTAYTDASLYSGAFCPITGLAY